MRVSLARLAAACAATSALALPAAALAKGAPDQADVGAQAWFCTDFFAFADNTGLPNNFMLGGFQFQDKPGGFAPFVNVFVDVLGQPVHGMQFDKRGLRITPPVPAAQAQVLVGAFSGAGVQLRAYDAAGALQDSAFVPNDATMHMVVLAAATAPIALVKLKGGNYEGIVNSVCTGP